MKHYFKKFLFLLLLWSSACSPAADTGNIWFTPKEDHPPEACCVLTGHPIQNPEGKRLGTITRVIVDIQTGQAAFVVVAVEDSSIWGKALMIKSNKKFIPLPWSVLTPTPEADAFVLRAELPLLLQAPAVEPGLQSLDEATQAEIEQFWASSETNLIHDPH